MSDVGSLFHSKSHEKLMQYLEEGGDKLLQKVLNFVEYGLGDASDEADTHKPFHRNTRTFAQLSLEQIRGLMQAWHGPLWAEQLARRTRLQQMRQLLDTVSLLQQLGATLRQTLARNFSLILLLGI
jgi:hypothetical protein